MEFGFLTTSKETVDKEFNEKKFTLELRNRWNCGYIGNVNGYIKKVDSINKTRIYRSSSGRYFKLEKKSKINYLILEIIELFELEVRRYNICTYRNKDYFMFECFPDKERHIRLSSLETVSENAIYIAVIHWILGIKGRLIQRKTGEIFSSEPYIIDYESTDFKKTDIKRLFYSKKIKKKVFNTFTNENKIDIMKDLMEDYRWWFIEARKRIRLLT